MRKLSTGKKDTDTGHNTEGNLAGHFPFPILFWFFEVFKRVFRLSVFKGFKTSI